MKKQSALKTTMKNKTTTKQPHSDDKCDEIEG